MKIEAYLSLGSNIGNRSENCKKALRELNKVDGIKLLATSNLYETRPVGYEDQANFVNMAAKIETDLSPSRLLFEMQNIEKRLGREKSFRWGPRIIDLDILLYGDKIINMPDLNIPHPRMNERAFVLIPLAEIGAKVKHPVSGIGIAELRASLEEGDGIRRLEADKI